MTVEPRLPIAALAPEIVLLVAGCLILLLGQSQRPRRRRLMPWIALAALVLDIVILLLGVWLAARWPTLSFAEGNGLRFGSIARFVRLSTLELGVLLTLVNWSQAREKERGEFLALMLFSLTGLLLVGPADNLLVLFLALELVSLPTYAMIVLSRDRPAGLEAGTKYFFLGALATAIMAYGFSFLYGVSGTAALGDTLDAVATALRRPGSFACGLATIGVVLSLGGILFKITAVPLHFYVADVYQGASSPVAGLLGFVPKLAGLVAIFKIVLLTGQWVHEGTAAFWLLWIIAAASMCTGNVLALRQTNIKRLLGYSAIAHAGYMLIGVLAGPRAGAASGAGAFGVLGDGTAAVLYYMVVYGIANLGAFAVLGLLRAGDEPCETLRDVAGLFRRHPGLALLLALALFTLMGLPPTPGFWGKLSLFGSALANARLTHVPGHGAWLIALVVLGVLNSALAAAYYLRVIAAALWYENPTPARAAPREAQQIGALLCGFMLLVLMFFPSGLLTASTEATAELDRRLDTLAKVSGGMDRPPSVSEEQRDCVVLDPLRVAPQDPGGLVAVKGQAFAKPLDAALLPIDQPLAARLEPGRVQLDTRRDKSRVALELRWSLFLGLPVRLPGIAQPLFAHPQPLLRVW
jgi:NADH-quinone oxidoreductase subunit N